LINLPERVLFSYKLDKYDIRNKIDINNDIRKIIMDKLDYSILAQLQQDGRKRYTEIAKSLGVTEGTVRNRVGRMIDDDVVRVIGLVDPLKVGFEAPAIIQVNVTPPHLETAAEMIKQFPEVSYLLMVAGDYDLMVEVRCRDRDHLASFILEKLQKVTGVTRTISAMVLQTYKLAEVSVDLNETES
jgi:Lrp/AsnC family transcriptional regulator for asnA, asnC and gidA